MSFNPFPKDSEWGKRIAEEAERHLASLPEPAWIRDRPVQTDILTPATAEELRLLRELPEVVENLLAEETNSYCEFCRQHAPKGFPDGELTGPVTHLQDCPAKAARDLLAALDRHREGR